MPNNNQVYQGILNANGGPINIAPPQPVYEPEDAGLDYPADIGDPAPADNIQVNLQWQPAQGNIGAAPQPMVGYANEAPAGGGFPDQIGGNQPNFNQNVYAQAAPKAVHAYQGQKYIPKQKKLVAIDDCCDEECSPSGNSGLRGMMVFYVNVQGQSPGQALDTMDKMKAQGKKTEKALVASKVEVMWLPSVDGDTRAEFFSFR